MSDFYLENLFRYEGAGTFVSGTSNPSAYLNVSFEGVNLADVGLVVGDTISASAVISNVTGGENVRLEIEYMNGANLTGASVGTHTSSYQNLTSLTLAQINGVVIPAGTVSMGLRLRRQSGSGTIRGHKGIINRGATAAPYARPFRGHSYTSLPLWAAGFSRVRFQQTHVDALFEPFGQLPITQDFNSGLSDYWEANYTTLPEESADMRRICAFFANVGLHGLVAVRDPLQLDPGEDARPAMLNGSVNGAGQAGSNSLISDGWPNSVLIAQAGDWLEVGTRYYMVTGDIRSSGSGTATITLWPKLVNVSDNALIHVNRPHLHAMLLNVPELDYFLANMAQSQSLAFREYK